MSIMISVIVGLRERFSEDIVDFRVLKLLEELSNLSNCISIVIHIVFCCGVVGNYSSLVRASTTMVTEVREPSTSSSLRRTIRKDHSMLLHSFVPSTNPGTCEEESTQYYRDLSGSSGSTNDWGHKFKKR